MDDPKTILRACEIAKEIMEQTLRETRPQLIDDIAKMLFQWISDRQREDPAITLDEIEAMWFGRDEPDEPAA
jgi:hypothetical protein